MTAPHRSTEQNAAARGIVLLVVAVVVGAFLLARGNSGSLLGDRTSSGGGGASGPPGGATSSTTSPPTTTPTTTKAAAATKVAVYNGTGGKVQSAAGNSRTKLVQSGYAEANVSINDTTQRSTSVVYYTSTVGRADAAAVAGALRLPNTTVQAVGTAVLPTSAKGYDIVVLLGLDAQTNPVITGGTTSGSSTSSSTPTTG